jgi:hypothetical protein
VLSGTDADEVAECWNGMSRDLDAALWNKCVIPNIEDSGPHDHSLAKYWHLLNEAEQSELNALAVKQDEERTKWITAHSGPVWPSSRHAPPIPSCPSPNLSGPPKTPSTNGVNIKNPQHKNLTQLLTKAVNQGH